MATKGMIDYLKNNSVTPTVEVKWAFTAKPDTAFNKVVYKVEWFHDEEDPAQVAYVAEMLEAENAYLATKGKPAIERPSCMREEKDKEKKPTGRYFIRAECKPKTNPLNGDRIPLPVCDAKKNVVTIPVFRGDRVKVATTWGGWDSAYGCGLKPYLNGVQILESNYKSGGAGINPFSEENGFDGGDTFVGSATEVPGDVVEPPFEQEEGKDIL